ncbi:unnamed protein product [Meganyctiphanes norvegica]|uniref:Uncharacterized protein n=1 Tax=Meganyctiphanes norvegica TaxID=48144 RepID=A0AAV2QZX5_MEGNR
MSSVKDHSRKKRVFTKKYFTEELKSAGALKIKTSNGVTQMALSKVSNMTVGLVIAAKGTKSFPDPIIVKWIKPGSKVTQLIERQFSMYDQLVQYLREIVNPEDVVKWKNLLRTIKYVWPVKNDGWSSLSGNEPIFNFEIQPEQLLSNVINIDKKDVAINSDAKVLHMTDNSLENLINPSESNYKSHQYENYGSLKIHEDQLTSKQTHCSDNDTENPVFKSVLLQQKDKITSNLVSYQENDVSLSYECKLDKENNLDHKTDYSEEKINESICKNEEADVSNLEKNIFRGSRENSLQRLIIDYKDITEPDDGKNTYSDRKGEISKMQQENTCIEEDNSMEKSFPHQFQESSSEMDINVCIEENDLAEKSLIQQIQKDCTQMDINDLNINEETKRSKKEISIGYTNSNEKISVPSSKRSSDIIIKKKRKKREMREEMHNENFKSYRVVILPEDPQCSFCERITHTIDTCPDRKRIKTVQYTTPRVRRYEKKKTRPKDLNTDNINSTFSVLKCATGSKFLYKTKSDKTPNILDSSDNITFFKKSQIKAEFLNPKRVEPVIANKWKKTTNTVSMKYDVEKKKKELLSKQIKELKELLNLFTNKKSNMSLEVKKTLLTTIKSLQKSIDNIRQQLNKNVVNKTLSTNIDSNTMANKEEEKSIMEVQNIEIESEKEKAVTDNGEEESSISVQNIEIESEKENTVIDKREEEIIMKVQNIESESEKEKSVGDAEEEESNMKVQNIEIKSEKEKIVINKQEKESNTMKENVEN